MSFNGENPGLSGLSKEIVSLVSGHSDARDYFRLFNTLMRQTKLIDFDNTNDTQIGQYMSLTMIFYAAKQPDFISRSQIDPVADKIEQAFEGFSRRKSFMVAGNGLKQILTASHTLLAIKSAF